MTISADGLTRDFVVPVNRDRGMWKALFGGSRVIRAVDHVSFRIEGGERVALLGLNGSGKSTLIKMLAGVIAPTAGSVQVLGFVPAQRKSAYLRRIGVMFGQKSLLFPDLTVMDALRLYQVIYGMPAGVFKQSLDDLDDFLAFRRLLDRPVRKLSLGERMRCEIVAALVHRPDVIYLDEPTIGLDVETRRGLADYLERRIGPEQTLILATHDLGFIKRLCSRLLLMNRGVLQQDLQLNQVQLVNYTRIEVRFDSIKSPDLLKDALAGARVHEERSGRIVLECAASDSDLVKKQLVQALDVTELTVGEAPIDAWLEELLHTEHLREPGLGEVFCMTAMVAEARRYLRFTLAYAGIAFRDLLAYRVDLFVKLAGYPARLIMVYFL